MTKLIGTLSLFCLSLTAHADFIGIGPYPGHPGNPYPDRNNVVQLTCSSIGHRYNECYVGGTISTVRINRQLSSSPCSFGSSWGFTNDVVYVDRGCQANFTVYLRDGYNTYPPYPPQPYPPQPYPPYPPQPGYGDADEVRCKSGGYSYRECGTDLVEIWDIQVKKRHSDADCDKGASYGIAGRDRIWVNDGCEATFIVRGRRY